MHYVQRSVIDIVGWLGSSSAFIGKAGTSGALHFG
jgi:hypothetical protein